MDARSLPTCLAIKGKRDLIQVLNGLVILRHAGTSSLLESCFRQRRIEPTLEAALLIPFGFPMQREIDRTATLAEVSNEGVPFGLHFNIKSFVPRPQAARKTKKSTGSTTGSTAAVAACSRRASSPL